MTKTSKKRPIPLPIQMVLGLVLGIVFGFLAPHFSQALAPVGTAFVQAIKMIVVPLVFTAITLGIYQMGNSAKQLGKVSVISLLYFFIATVVAIIIGLALNGMFHPGVGVNLSHTAELPKNINTTVNWTKFFLDMIPSNVFAAMSGTNLLPVLVFAVLLGLALASTGSRAKPLVDVLDALM